MFPLCSLKAGLGQHQTSQSCSGSQMLCYLWSSSHNMAACLSSCSCYDIHQSLQVLRKLPGTGHPCSPRSGWLFLAHLGGNVSTASAGMSASAFSAKKKNQFVSLIKQLMAEGCYPGALKFLAGLSQPPAVPSQPPAVPIRAAEDTALPCKSCFLPGRWQWQEVPKSAQL